MDVYVLKDPVNGGTVRYVGITRQPLKERLRQHIKTARTRARRQLYLNPKDQWILFLLSIGQKPIITPLSWGLNEETAVREEKKIIATFKRVGEGGKLLNRDEGGSYDICDGKRAWNRGWKDCFDSDLKNRMIHHQPGRKEVFRFDKRGNFLDSWISLRTMCNELGLDRRSVMRCLSNQPHYSSHKGFMFSYSREDVPVYHNKSSLRRKSNSPHARPICGIKNGKSIEFGSITEAMELCGICYLTIHRALKTGRVAKGYYWYYLNPYGDVKK
ncbi:GIY-YIG nuclease family protein [Alistipes indistinctus]|uniref:GIY-YIG nuclease family protein n=1 Tax=Alistipes indistinctus TaxID=626932 RepID=UPI003F0D403D